MISWLLHLVNEGKEMRAQDICTTAAQLVGGDRAKTHGDKLSNFQATAALWSAFLDTEISASQVGIMMVLLKVARTKGGAVNPDDYIDMAGYAGCAGEVALTVDAWAKDAAGK